MSNLIIGIAILAVALTLYLKLRARRLATPVEVVPDRTSRRDRPCPRCQYTLGYKPAPCRKCRIYPQPNQA
ncbi:hypothetical protein FCL40_09885 [Ferrimonas sediminicola]|uniref:Uncharacterized protein n=1 Tax=Ferrimonas sediminicola TaxID=2569538 RepID=A0A4U1BF13_9GAMM|nr:hypothetical protein [Ferrimonas sediminicola]TKB48940.1 hypothetical protein FCL40_09885 [Ferrimonas sediminicola]